MEYAKQWKTIIRAFFSPIPRDLQALILGNFGINTNKSAKGIIFRLGGQSSHMKKRIRKNDQKRMLIYQSIKKIKKRKDSSTLT